MQITNNIYNHHHTISDPDSGYTDVSLGHRHRLRPECALCNKTQERLGVRLTALSTGYKVSLHLHKIIVDPVG